MILNYVKNVIIFLILKFVKFVQIHQEIEEIICVVEDVRDVMAIENTSQFKGLYHVLGGKISPIEGIGPQNLTIDSLIEKVKSRTIKEVIFALSSTIEGDTTNFYIFKQIRKIQYKNINHCYEELLLVMS